MCNIAFIRTWRRGTRAGVSRRSVETERDVRYEMCCRHGSSNLSCHTGWESSQRHMGPDYACLLMRCQRSLAQMPADGEIPTEPSPASNQLLSDAVIFGARGEPRSPTAHGTSQPDCAPKADRTGPHGSWDSESKPTEVSASPPAAFVGVPEHTYIRARTAQSASSI